MKPSLKLTKQILPEFAAAWDFHLVQEPTMDQAGYGV